MTKATSKSLEDAMQELEALVTRMESGDLSLDDSLAAFEQGIALSKQCQSALKEAEQRVSILLGKSADAPLSDFSGTAATENSVPQTAQQSSDGFDDDIPF